MPDRYAVIGNPIRQSKSPIIHTAFAAATGQSIQYDALEGALGGFQAAAGAFRSSSGRGLNVTAPFKLEAFDYATVRHGRARLAGAANCLSFVNGAIEAENFDGLGLLRDITINLAVLLFGRSILLLGAGGAARGALIPLLTTRPARLVLANRTLARAQELAHLFPDVHACRLDDLDSQDAFDLVINATSTSVHAERLRLPVDLYREDAVAYDMTYGRGLTAFLRHAGSNGAARLYDGVGMLVKQAAEAFAWWRGVCPATHDVIVSIGVPLR